MIYLDTNILIYLFENHQEYASKVAAFLDENQKNDTPLITSVISVTELTAGNQNITIDTLKLLQGLKIVPVDETIASLAGDLIAQDKMHIGDAIHFATALNAKCNAIYTNDDYLAKKASKKLKIIKP
ncbi:PIN domain-containing protein [Candidatus Saccharibacteria bacterium]|nr:PIN domain-containing protein [Candidatus Saccharibacteria bacterium]